MAKKKRVTKKKVGALDDLRDDYAAAKKKVAGREPEMAWIAEDLRPLAVPIGELVPDPRNARTHDKANVDSIAASLEQFGQRKPIVVNRVNSQIESGNGTLEAAKQLGWSHLAVVRVKDDPAQQTGFSIADNRTGQLADWDNAVLADLLSDVQEQSPDLYDTLNDALLLDELIQDEPEDATPAGGKEEASEVWQVIIECEDKEHQKRAFKACKQGGYKCRRFPVPK